MEIVEETEMLAEESPFIDLEAYKGQDDRQAKSLRTPGLFTPTHYVLAHGKVTLDVNFGICVCQCNHFLCLFSSSQEELVW